jgi:hypothetical protein
MKIYQSSFVLRQLEPPEMRVALNLWAQGWNTLAIARIFEVHESVIYNGFYRLKIQKVAAA